MRLSELSGKEVINLADGERLGIIGIDCELEFDADTGSIHAIVIPAKSNIFNLLGERRPIMVPWPCVRRVGEDVMIVDLTNSYERLYNHRKRMVHKA